MSASMHNVGKQQRRETRVLSLASLLLGIVSILGAYLLGAPAIGLALGILALKREAHRTMAIWGIVLNSIMLAGAAITILLLVVGLAFITPFAIAMQFVAH